MPSLSEDATQVLGEYSFPGNVRELENILERAYTLCEGDQIRATDLQINKAANTPAAGPQPAGIPPFEGFESLEAYLENIERTILLQTLEQYRWNRTAAAPALGISFRQLRYRLQKLGLDKD